MLAIRMQRTGRKNHAEFRVIVQESRMSPSSGRIVKQLGHYNPHAKTVVLDKDLAQTYLNNGAQPSPRVVRLFEAEGVKLPSWVKTTDMTKTRTTRNPDKLRRNRPAEPVQAAPLEAIPEEEPLASKEPVASEESAAEEPASEEAQA
jgi:small subunit ribosomal protein S16